MVGRHRARLLPGTRDRRAGPETDGPGPKTDARDQRQTGRDQRQTGRDQRQRQWAVEGQEKGGGRDRSGADGSDIGGAATGTALIDTGAPTLTLTLSRDADTDG